MSWSRDLAKPYSWRVRSNRLSKARSPDVETFIYITYLTNLSYIVTIACPRLRWKSGPHLKSQLLRTGLWMSLKSNLNTSLGLKSDASSAVYKLYRYVYICENLFLNVSFGFKLKLLCNGCILLYFKVLNSETKIIPEESFLFQFRVREVYSYRWGVYQHNYP
jgi:hypothetical protein